jgi:rare lipoprotein A
VDEMSGRALAPRRAKKLAWVLLVACVAACATRAPDGPARTTAVASWYGPGFHGRRTASGERYDQHELTAAHRTWPLGTPVRVTDLQSGRSVVVRINDRGPYVAGREIDLSYGAARALGVVDTGTAQVRLEPLEGRIPRAVGFAVQVGSFLDVPHAQALRRRVATLAPLDADPMRRVPRGVYVAQGEHEQRVVYRVRVGPCASRREAEKLASRLVGAGLDPIVVEETLLLD